MDKFKEFQSLKKEYKNTPIPTNLDKMIATSLRKNKRQQRFYTWSISSAVAALLLTTIINLNPNVANAVSNVPYMTKIVEVLTFNEVKEEIYNTSINMTTPKVTGFENKEFEQSINNKFLEESNELYKEFTSKNKVENFSIESDYEIVTTTPTLLSIRQLDQRTQASSYTKYQYITLDKENEVLITLKSLFKNDQYIEIISKEIKRQMVSQMQKDSNKSYFISADDMEPFKQIDSNQEFYITAQNKLVIAFDEYEVAPGYMGPVEFEIPTSSIKDILVGERYIH